MKSLKKLLLVVVLALTLTLAFGCNISLGGNSVKVDDKTGETEVKVDLQTVFNAIVKELGDRANVVSDMTLPTSKDDVSIVWTSDKPEIISNDGKVNRPLDDTTVTLSCILKYGSDTKQFNIAVTVKGNRSELPDGYDKIGEVIAKEAGATVAIHGVVVAMTSQSFLVKDDTGYILAYRGRDWKADLTVGELVKVNGVTAEYAGMKQFGTDATYEKEEGTGTDSSTFEKLDAAKFDALTENLTVKLVSVTGKLIKSGNYWNLEVEGATNKGSVSYPAQNLDELDQKNVELTGYFVGVTGSTTKYINFILVSIKEVEGGSPVVPPEEMEATIAQVIASEAGSATFKTTATVVACAKTGILVKDSTGMIFCYMTEVPADVKVGSVVELVGKSSVYGGFKQFDKPTVTVKGEEEVTQPTPADLNKDDYESLLTATSLGYYKFTAALSISNNKYYNLKLEDSDVAGSLVAPSMDVSSFNGKKIEIEAYFVYVGGSTTKYIYFIATSVKEAGGTDVPTETIEGTISEVLAGTVGATYKTTGTVVAVNAQSFLVQDASGIILAYIGSDYEKDLEVGDVVNLEGKTSTYQGSVQFNKPAYEKTGTKNEVTYPTPTKLTAETYEALNTTTPTTQYVEVTGYVTISTKYVNFEVMGAKTMGSIAYPVDDMTAYDEKLVKITGYYTYASGSDTKYINIIATKLEDADDSSILAFIKNDIDSMEKIEVVASLDLATEAMGATITWASSNPDVIKNNGELVPPTANIDVTLTATIKLNDKTETASFVVTVKAPETIESIRALTDIDQTIYHYAAGVVVANHKEGFLIKDSTGLILVYRGADTEIPAVGTKVTVYGTLSVYGGVTQFNKGTLYGVLGKEEVTYPEATVLDKDTYEALVDSTTISYYKLRAKLSISGKYHNLLVNGSTIQGSLASPSGDLTALDGKYVDVEGYFIYTTGSTTKYIYFIGVSVEEAILSDAEYIAMAEEDILKMNGKVVKKDMELPLESNRCTVTWVSSNPAIIANDGKFVMPEADTEVTLTATITKGEETKSVEIKVTAKYTDPTAVVATTYNFGENSDYLTWSNSYSEHTLTYDEITVKFEKANKQTSGNAIDDVPVTKGNYVLISSKEGSFGSVTLTFKQWGTKAQGAKISVSTDGGATFTETNYKISIVDTVSLEMEFSTEVNAIKVVFDNQSNQVGIVSVAFTIK